MKAKQICTLSPPPKIIDEVIPGNGGKIICLFMSYMCLKTVICNWERTEISSPFTPAPSTPVVGEDSSSILTLTPASASHCYVLLRSWLSGWCKGKHPP